MGRLTNIQEVCKPFHIYSFSISYYSFSLYYYSITADVDPPIPSAIVPVATGDDLSVKSKEPRKKTPCQEMGERAMELKNSSSENFEVVLNGMTYFVVKLYAEGHKKGKLMFLVGKDPSLLITWKLGRTICHGTVLENGNQGPRAFVAGNTVYICPHSNAHMREHPLPFKSSSIVHDMLPREGEGMVVLSVDLANCGSPWVKAVVLLVKVEDGVASPIYEPFTIEYDVVKSMFYTGNLQADISITFDFPLHTGRNSEIQRYYDGILAEMKQADFNVQSVCTTLYFTSLLL